MNTHLTIKEEQELRQLAGNRAWELARRLIIKEDRLLEIWLMSTRFVAWVPGSFILGIANSQHFFRESLIRYEPIIERHIRQVLGNFGRDIQIHILVIDDLIAFDFSEWDAFE